MFYLTTHSTHFIYRYMASDIWLRTILIVRKETRSRHIGYSYRLTARVLLYAPSHPIQRLSNQLQVIATDGGTSPRSSSTTVSIDVTDVNDNSPAFSPTFYDTEIAYTGECDSSITTVTATDADSGSNGQLDYYLVQSTYQYLFSIDSTGVPCTYFALIIHLRFKHAVLGSHIRYLGCLSRKVSWCVLLVVRCY